MGVKSFVNDFVVSLVSMGILMGFSGIAGDGKKLREAQDELKVYQFKEEFAKECKNLGYTPVQVQEHMAAINAELAAMFGEKKPKLNEESTRILTEKHLKMHINDKHINEKE